MAMDVSIRNEKIPKRIPTRTDCLLPAELEASSFEVFGSPPTDALVSILSPFETIELEPEAKALLSDIETGPTPKDSDSSMDRRQKQAPGHIGLPHHSFEDIAPALRLEKRAMSSAYLRTDDPGPFADASGTELPPSKRQRDAGICNDFGDSEQADDLLDMALEVDDSANSNPSQLPDDLFMLTRLNPTLPLPTRTLAMNPQKHPDHVAHDMCQPGPRNSETWKIALLNIESRRLSLEPLTCLVALAIISDRTLCHGMSGANIDPVDTAELEADIVVSPKTAVVFQHVAALASDCDRLASYLGGLCDRFQHVTVVMVVFPRKKQSDSIGIYPDPWSSSAIKAFKKLQDSVSRRKAFIASTCETASAIDTTYEYVMSDHAEMSGLIVRLCAERDQLEYAKESGSDCIRAIFVDRDYLRWENNLASIGIDPNSAISRYQLIERHPRVSVGPRARQSTQHRQPYRTFHCGLLDSGTIDARESGGVLGSLRSCCTGANTCRSQPNAKL